MNIPEPEPPQASRAGLTQPEYEVKASNLALRKGLRSCSPTRRDEVRLAGIKVRAMYESDATALDWNAGYQPDFYASQSLEERLRGAGERLLVRARWSSRRPGCVASRDAAATAPLGVLPVMVARLDGVPPALLRRFALPLSDRLRVRAAGRARPRRHLRGAAPAAAEPRQEVRGGVSIEIAGGAARRAASAMRRRSAPARARVAALDLILMLALFALAIIPRAAWVAYNDRAPQGLNDPTLYALRRLIADGDGYTRPTGEKFAYYPVGYPATLGGLKKARRHLRLGRSIFSIKMMNGMFGAITVAAAVPAGARASSIAATGIVAGAAAGRLSRARSTTPARCSRSRCSRCCWIGGAARACCGTRGRATACRGTQLFAAGVLLSYATMTRGITLMFPLVLLAVWFF